MKGRITLNYSQTRYMNTSQSLDFTIKGSNEALEFSHHVGLYKAAETSILVTSVLSMMGLLVGLFVPKFIGLQAIITMQLIFYSQLLIDDVEKWPIGFMYFTHLKVATGYN